MTLAPRSRPARGAARPGRGAARRLSEASQRRAKAAGGKFVLRLYVVGSSATSRLALSNLLVVLDRDLAGRYDLRVVDLYREPQMSEKEGLVAAPTLVRERPLPRERLVGDLSEEEQLLAILEVERRRRGAR